MSTELLAHEEVESRGPHWVSQAAFPLVSGITLFGEMVLAFAVYRDCYWLAVPLVLVISHFMHGQLIGFHEASHGLLRRSRKLNEIDGVLIGTFSFLSFSLYRAAHQTHHAHLGTERDEEFWPFVNPDVPRWARIAAAILELNLGLIFTPLIFLRTFFRRNSPIRSRKVRRRIWAELAFMFFVWTTLLLTSWMTNGWKYLLWMYLAPAVIAGNLQSWRKYIEHVGLTSATIRGSTRSVIAKGPVGKFVALTLLHEPFHGVHHQRAGIHHWEMPQFAADLEPMNEEEPAPFRSYWHALMHLLGTLADPRVGPQWKRSEAGN